MARVAAWSQRGARPSNQDACVAEVAETAHGEVGLIAVCDGVGGLAQGALASSTVAAGLSRWFEDELPGLVGRMASGGAPDTKAVQTSWARLIARLDGLLAAHGRSIGHQVGTTLTAALVTGQGYALAHVGDCRAYLISGGEVRRLTRDQTVPIAGSGGTGASVSHSLLQAVGAGQELCPVFSAGRCLSGDLLVICSDGAWRRTGTDGVGWAFAGMGGADEEALEEGCRRLVRLALSRGERDNLTVACLAAGGVGGVPEPVTVILSEASDDVATEMAGGAR